MGLRDRVVRDLGRPEPREPAPLALEVNDCDDSRCLLQGSQDLSCLGAIERSGPDLVDGSRRHARVE